MQFSSLQYTRTTRQDAALSIYGADFLGETLIRVGQRSAEQCNSTTAYCCSTDILQHGMQASLIGSTAAIVDIAIPLKNNIYREGKVQ